MFRSCLPARRPTARAVAAMATPAHLPSSITPSALHAALASPSPPTLLDASWFMPGGRDAAAEFAAGPRIAGSLFFDVDAVTDKSSQLPHMLPPVNVFAAVADALGVESPSSPIAVYDRAGIFSAPRVWWTWRAMGHDNITVLDGGLPAWLAAGLPMEEGPPKAGAADTVASAAASPPPNPRYPAALQPALIRDVDAMKANVDSRAEAVLDARPAARFAGTAPEPRAGLAGGHIPGSASVPFGELLNTDTGTLKPLDEVRTVLEAAGWRPGATNVATCGSGVTASILAWGAAVCGLDDGVAVYDGSWSEWGGRDDTPKETIG